MIAIIGAGLSGLAVGRALQQANTEFTIFEATARPGGVIRSGKVDGALLEWGPQRARLTAGLRSLASDLGVARDLVVAPAGLPLLVYSRGALRRVPFSLGAALRSDLFTPATRLRLLAEPFTAPADREETAAAYFRRRFGRRAYEDLLGPLFGGLYASDPEDMLVRHALAPVLRQLGAERSALLALGRHALRRTAAGTPACSFTEGLETLTNALAGSIGSRLALQTPVQALLPGPQGGYTLETARGTVHADHVVLTVPAAAAANLLRPLAPAPAERIGSLRYNHFAVVHLRSAARIPAMGYQVSFAERLATRGVTFNDALFGRAGVHTAFLGGARDPELLGSNADDALATLAAREFQLITGHSAEPLAVSRVEIPAWDRSWTALEGIELPEGVVLCANWESRAGIPGRFSRAAQVAAQLTGRAPAPGPR